MDAALPTADALVVENLELVGRIVSEVSARYPRHVDRSELWNVGALGLVEASRRFDPAAGIPFARYAAIRIRGAIIDSTRTRDWATRSVRRRGREVEAARSDLAERLGRAPTSAEVAAQLHMSPEEIHALEARVEAGRLLSLDPAPGSEETSLADRLAEQRAEMSPEQALEQAELRGALIEAIRRLPSVQAEVIFRSFLEGEALHEIAADLGLTEARLSQIRREALTSLQAYFSTLYDEVSAPQPDLPGRRAREAFLAAMGAETDWRKLLTAGSAAIDVARAVRPPG